MSPYSQIKGYDEIVRAAEPNRGGFGALNAAFGNSAEAFLGDRKPDKRTGQIEANWKDRLFGHSTEELTEEYYKKKVDRLLEDKRVTKYLEDTKDYGGQIGIRDQQGTIDSKIGKYNQAQKLRGNYLADGIVVSPQFRTVDQIAAEGERLKTKKSGEEGGALETLRYNRNLATQERADANQLLLLQQQNLMADREDRRLDRQMERQLAERRLDLQEARDFRKDRQAAIMQIMQGFRQMGNAFAY